MQRLDGGCLEILHIFLQATLLVSRILQKWNMRLWDLIVLKREGCSRFFAVPIAIVARLSSENESNPCRAKHDQNHNTSEPDFMFLANFFSTRIELVLQAQMSYDSHRYLKKTRTNSSL